MKHLADRAKAPPASDADLWLPVALEADPRDVAVTLQRIGYHGRVWVATDGMWLLQQRFAGNVKRAVPFEVALNAAGAISGAKYGD